MGEESTAVEELREELEIVFPEAFFPVEEPFDLIDILPDGGEHVFSAGGHSIPARHIGMQYTEYIDFPYDRKSKLIDDIVEGAKEVDQIHRERDFEHSMTIEFGSEDE